MKAIGQDMVFEKPFVDMADSDAMSAVFKVYLECMRETCAEAGVKPAKVGIYWQSEGDGGYELRQV